MTAQPATPELLALARATRDDIDLRDLEGAINQARAAGKSWPWILTQVAGMLARDEDPRDLRNAINPLGLKGTR